MAQNDMELKRKPMEFPCKSCEDRYAGCHAECERYLRAKAENAKINQMAKEIINKELIYSRYRIDNARKVKKRNG